MVIPNRPTQRSGRFLRRCGASLAMLGALAVSPAQAATFGHARLASAAGRPLVVVVPVTGLTAADLQTLSAQPAPAAAWAQAGLTPPVALESLSVSVAPGVGNKSDRELRIHSPQAFTGTLADILLDVKTATGSERYQVSLIAPGPAHGQPTDAGAAQPSGTRGPALGSAQAPTSVRRVPAGSIRVHTGDTMFAIARRHRVEGVSIYQLMLALQRANPQAFIHQNINLVRAGASLAVPDVADMLSISDAEARRQFVAQTAAFDRMRGRHASRVPAARGGSASAGTVQPSSGAEPAAAKPAPGDRVRLSEGRNDRADARTAQGHALADAESRVNQLQDNVENLNQALQTQGEAARDIAASGAHAIGQSIQKIAGAISQASHEAAAQAADRAEETAAGVAGGTTSTGNAAAPGANMASGASAAPGTAGASGSAGASGASGTAGTSGATAASGPAAPGAVSPGGPASPSGAAAASAPSGAPHFGASAPGTAGNAPVDEAKASANAESAELQASAQTQHRVNWLQDHLLGVMTALLALIVFIIAWLLRRANAARDEADTDPRITEAMVQEKLQDIDLDLPPSTQPESAASRPEA
jgi:pilus assembly protein FimV